MLIGCADGDIHLIGGRQSENFSEGRVEICSNGVWGTIYDGGYWNRYDAIVVCRQLGYQGNLSIVLIWTLNHVHQIGHADVCELLGLFHFPDIQCRKNSRFRDIIGASLSEPHINGTSLPGLYIWYVCHTK
jgi:hypothetical protein